MTTTIVSPEFVELSIELAKAPVCVESLSPKLRQEANLMISGRLVKAFTNDSGMTVIRMWTASERPINLILRGREDQVYAASLAAKELTL
jgi:hypothetical protein